MNSKSQSPSKHITIGLSGFIFLEMPNLPVIVPSDVIAWKIKKRPGDVARIILRYQDRTEMHYLVEDENKLIPINGAPLAINMRSKK